MVWSLCRPITPCRSLTALLIQHPSLAFVHQGGQYFLLQYLQHYSKQCWEEKLLNWYRLGKETFLSSPNVIHAFDGRCSAPPAAAMRQLHRMLNRKLSRVALSSPCQDDSPLQKSQVIAARASFFSSLVENGPISRSNGGLWLMM